MIEMDGKDIQVVMRHLKKAMGTGADGKAMKRELSKQLRKTMDPLLARMRQNVLGLPSKGQSKGQSMRQAIAKQLKATTRWSGDNTGVSVIQKARGMPRNFRMAGRMFNREEGWHPHNLGGVVEHQQVRPAMWFDSETPHARMQATHDIQHALEAAAVTIARSAK